MGKHSGLEVVHWGPKVKQSRLKHSGVTGQQGLQYHTLAAAPSSEPRARQKRLIHSSLQDGVGSKLLQEGLIHGFVDGLNLHIVWISAEVWSSCGTAELRKDFLNQLPGGVHSVHKSSWLISQFDQQSEHQCIDQTAIVSAV